MNIERIIVFLPCHSLGDFPTWLEDDEAENVLGTWTAAWHPELIAAAGRPPEWASADFLPHDLMRAVGIVPTSVEERFASHIDASALEGAYWVRDVSDREDIVADAMQGMTDTSIPPERSTALFAEDFYALGLAWLLGDLLARQMRTEMELHSTDFEETVVRAARSAVNGSADDARRELAECFHALEATRSQYYAVDMFLLDTLLLAESTLGKSLTNELRTCGPISIVASGEVIETLANENPEALAIIRDRLSQESIGLVGGRYGCQPLDLSTPQAMESDFERGWNSWEQHIGRTPSIFGQISGGMSPELPDILRKREYTGSFWNLYDGTSLPDAGASRILWQGRYDAAIDAVARPPLDVRSVQTFLKLAEHLSDAMDHDHTVVIQFAHYPGTSCRWHNDFRRIASWCKLFGEFVTPEDLFRRTSGAGSAVSFPEDSYPITLPQEHSSLCDQIQKFKKVAVDDAKAYVNSHAGSEKVHGTIVHATNPTASQKQSEKKSNDWLSCLRKGFFGQSQSSDMFVLENKYIRAKVHRDSGGLVSVRQPREGVNRISQRLAVRSTLPSVADGRRWEDAHDRVRYSKMVAEAVEYVENVIQSRGHLLGLNGEEASFTQRVSLLQDQPLVLLEFDIQLCEPLSTNPFENYAACRFAWHENEMPDVLRSLNLKPIVTERWRFTSPHVIEVRTESLRTKQVPVQIFSLGLPWHVRSGEHMLDTMLPADEQRSRRTTMALGIGLENPCDVAMSLMAHATESIDETG